MNVTHYNQTLDDPHGMANPDCANLLGPFEGSPEQIRKALKAAVYMQQKFYLIDWGMLDAFGQTRFLWAIEIEYWFVGGKIEVLATIKKARVARLLWSYPLESSIRCVFPIRLAQCSSFNPRFFLVYAKWKSNCFSPHGIQEGSRSVSGGMLS